MAQRCECGLFISFHDMEHGLARFHYVPDSAYSAEACEWMCQRCDSKQLKELIHEGTSRRQEF